MYCGDGDVLNNRTLSRFSSLSEEEERSVRAGAGDRLNREGGGDGEVRENGRPVDDALGR